MKKIIENPQIGDERTIERFFIARKGFKEKGSKIIEKRCFERGKLRQKYDFDWAGEYVGWNDWYWED
jgi:hypothetical protein